MGRLSIVTPAAQPPVSLATVRAHLRVETRDEDDLLDVYVKSACAEIEAPDGWLGRSLLARSMMLTLDEAPGEFVDLPAPPLVAVTDVSYRDADGVFTAIPTTDYEVDTISEPGRVRFIEDLPADLDPGYECLRIEYTAGYATEEDLPGPVRAWILLRVGELYRDREASIIGTIQARLPHADRLLDGLRIRK